MNYIKLKHLSKFCCNPSNEFEFEAVEMAANLAGIGYMRAFKCHQYAYYNSTYKRIMIALSKKDLPYLEVISVYDFIQKIRMSEEDAIKLEDPAVETDIKHNYELMDAAKGFKAYSGYYFRVSQDGTEVTLHRSTYQP